MIDRLHASNKALFKKDLFNPEMKNWVCEDKELSYILYNPSGLWYSKNIEYWEGESNFNYIDSKYKYSFDISDLKIKKINNINQLIKFTEKYMRKDFYEKSANIIDWEKVKEDYDGLEIFNDSLFNVLGENFDSLCEDIFKDEEFKYTKSQTLKLNNYILNNLNDDRCKTVWCLGWGYSSGVIFNNIKKLKLKRIKIIYNLDKNNNLTYKII
jgi:hypothetical protein